MLLAANEPIYGLPIPGALLRSTQNAPSPSLETERTANCM